MIDIRQHDFIDQFTDARVLAERVPRYKPRFEAIKDVREYNEAMYGYGRDNHKEGMRRVASIPEAVLSRIQELDPEFLLSRPKFYAWLDRHPEYQTIRRA